MSKIEPTLGAPMAPSRIDFAALLARQSERDARIAALRPANKERLFDGLTAAGITHVTVSFDGYGDSGQVESIEAYAGDAEVTFPKTQIAYAALTWDDPEVEMRALSLEDAVEQLAYDLLSDTHGGWENNDGAYVHCQRAQLRSYGSGVLIKVLGEQCWQGQRACRNQQFSWRDRTRWA